MAMASQVYYYEDEDQANGTYHFKILVPCGAAGAIIGRGGETIAQLQEETGTKVKMSKSKDFYPGTKERVCLITGSVKGIIRIHDFVMEKIIEKRNPDAQTAFDFDHKQPVAREKQVKILIPKSTVGMIIGKGGNYIEKIKEESGAFVQISQNPMYTVLAERCITIIGEMENNKIACQMILAKIVEDPFSGSCRNVSYENVTGPLANFSPTGSPFAKQDSVPSSAVTISNFNCSFDENLNNSSPTRISNFQNPQTACIHSETMPFTRIGVDGSTVPSINIIEYIESIKTILRGNGYSEQAVAEISAAMNTLANYGLLEFDPGILNRMHSVPVVNGLQICIPISSNTNYPGTPGCIANQDICASATDVPEMECAFNSMAISGPMEAVSNMFSKIDSLENSMFEIGPASGSTSPTTTSANDRFLVQSEAAVFEEFCTTSPALVSPTATTLTLNKNSFGLGIGFGSGPPSSLPEENVLDFY